MGGQIWGDNGLQGGLHKSREAGEEISAKRREGTDGWGEKMPHGVSHADHMLTCARNLAVTNILVARNLSYWHLPSVT